MDTRRNVPEPPRRGRGRPPLGPRTRKGIAIPKEEWPRYGALIGGPLGHTDQDVLLNLIRLGYAANQAGLTVR
jgi:hypothetical protein